jgi:hypothetical protein
MSKSTVDMTLTCAYAVAIKTLRITKAWKNWGYRLKAATGGEDIGIVSHPI